MTGKKDQKKDKPDRATIQLFNFAPDSYLERTSRPVYAIVFLLPFIVFYEVGTLLINTDVLSQSQVRVVAFVWLQHLMQSLGVGIRVAWIAPPLVVVVILAALQLVSRKPWHFWPVDLAPMVLECIALAVPLIILSLFFNSPTVGPHEDAPLNCCVRLSRTADLASTDVNATQQGATPAPDAAPRSLMANIVIGVGAGIYEELVFRLVLIGVLLLVLQDVFRLDRRNAIVLAVLVSAALFSAHHHITWADGQLERNAPFQWVEFGFRTVAGIYFAILFAIRGFGITAGAHAFYDVIATIVNAFFFTP
jgi:hypothetical protein